MDRRPRRESPGAHRARKRFGQHFLTDPRILARIANALAARDGDTVLEVGPGRGALTEELLARVGPAGHVVAVEVDRDLSAALRLRYAMRPELTLVEGDFLQADLTAHVRAPFLLAGNIPYNITTPILFKALDPPRAARMVMLVQREVAERIAARAGTRAYGALSANVQAVATVEVLFRVAAGAFSPPPKVESAVIRITPRPDPVVTPAEEPAFRDFVQALFSFRRKQLVRALREALDLAPAASADLVARAGLDPTARPEVLSPADFATLLRARSA
ncbi:MAG: 16S rRNA (adenine(1518)-N(6)/adenine(1519)-N(6))-dimethyltransferase RsmA [Gemmatimonadota bacterium]|nr:16S rRNA (adenine(1518)-N(6)/adenine(1519)-N(6))-dimethyltransferase RsmA [Gemmatimonadota bacterium]